MARPIARTAHLALALVLLALGGAHAADLARPVPSNAQVTRFTRFNIRYSIRDTIASGVQRVDFYISEDMGGTWRLYGDDPDRVSPMTVEVPGEGVYGFVCVVTDRNGNREREPGPRTRPETVIVVDRTPPDAKWIAPRQNILGRGQTVELSWESSDDYLGENPVTLQYAVNATGNNDSNANWVTIEENLPAVGTYRWTPEESRNHNLRLIAEDRAGNMAIAYCPATISVDNIAPTIRTVQPLRSNKLENDIIIDAEDNPGGSGVKEFSLYVSENGAATWTLQKEVGAGNESVPVKRRPGDVITFKAPKSGDYALWPVVFDEAGNATPLPSVGTAGPYILVIDDEPPVVTLSDSFLYGRNAILTNDQRLVQWTAYDPHLQPNSASIELSLDNGNTWQGLRSMLPTSGSETITFPFGMQSEDAKLRVTVSDEFGNVGESVSQAFKLSNAETTIDAVTPRTPSSGPDIPFPSTTEPSFPPISTPAQDWMGGMTTPTPLPTTPQPEYPGYPPLDTTPAFPTPTQQEFPLPSGDIFGGGAGDIYSSTMNHQSESTASHLPQAIMSGQSGQSASSASQWPTSQPEPTGSFGGDSEGAWMPSGQASTAAPTAPATMPWDTLGDQGSGSDDTAWLPSGGQPSWNTGAGTSWDTGAGLSAPDSGGSFEPSTSSWDSAPSLPPLDMSQQGGSLDFDAPGLSFDNVPNLGGQDIFASQSTTPAGASSLRPPGSDFGTTPTQSFDFGSPEPMIPPTTPVGDTFGSTFAPPDLRQPETPPASARQQSEHFVRESKAFRDENRPDLAKDSAEKAFQADAQNPNALMELSQVLARIDPPDFVRAANLAREAATIRPDWESWWNCAEVFYTWSHASNREIQAYGRSNQNAPLSLVDDRNATLQNAQIAINNAASVVSSTGDRAAAKKVAVTQGMITYLRALTVAEPYNPGESAGAAAMDEYRRQQGTYKATVAPLLEEALPFFDTAMGMDGPPQYTETFQIGIINFRLAGLERDTGNVQQAGHYYQQAARYLEEATTAGDAPSGGPREAYYMLALSHEQLASMGTDNRARHVELALRYWRQTADFYAADTPYGSYARQRIDALTGEMGL